MVGVLFVMAARLDRMATSATSDNRQLQLAVETVLAQINEELVEDIPDVGMNQEHYDYPDSSNAWLAALEPDPTTRRWPQISRLGGAWIGQTTDVAIDLMGQRDAGPARVRVGGPADADGDGVGDAKWFGVSGISSSKGKPVYAAVRIVDNGGMLNVNAGFKFDLDPNDPYGIGVDGSRQLQINAVALGKRSAGPAALLEARAYDVTHPDVHNLRLYERNVIWQFAEPAGIYTPFDLSDELELRYRYLLDHRDIDTRVEYWGLFRGGVKHMPYAFVGDPLRRDAELLDWLQRAALDGGDPNAYAYRHIATTHSVDRLIAPQPFRDRYGTLYETPVNVNSANLEAVLAAVRAALGDDPGTDLTAAQIAVNLVDYIDDDSVISYIDLGSARPTILGYERPCIYISELAYSYAVDADGIEHRSYAVELYKPDFNDVDPSKGLWRLIIPGGPEIPIDEWSKGSRRFHVVLREDPLAELGVSFNDPEEPQRFSTGYDHEALVSDTLSFAAGDHVSLQRKGPRAGEWFTVDELVVPSDWMDDVNAPESLERDIMAHHCVLRFWVDPDEAASPTLGAPNVYQNMGPVSETTVQAYPADKPLTNIGEIGKVFAKGLYCRNGQNPFGLDLVGYTTSTDSPPEVLIDLANPVYAGLLNYLMVPLNPFASQSAVRPAETRIKGRININTAPAFVLAQLPWMKRPWRVDPNGNRSEDLTIPRAIVSYRNQRGPFRSIADLMQVYAVDVLGDRGWPMRELGFDDRDNLYSDVPRGPDLSPDVARDDMEERDLLLTRISNLVTLRSDVYTAYILVRLGADGPQKRMVAILDRSAVSSRDHRVEVLALHAVPDPR